MVAHVAALQEIAIAAAVNLKVVRIANQQTLKFNREDFYLPR
jgi:hypothetical protein